MKINKLTVTDKAFPDQLRKIKAAPKTLYCQGADLRELLKRPAVTIVGTRLPTAYGKQVTAKLAGELAEQGIVIISGLAYGVDAIAHKSTLEAGGLAIAVLPGPLEKLYPAQNRHLAQQILVQGGALVSEHPAGAPVFKTNFVARNRIMAWLSKAVLITEAGEDSGSSHTVDFALQENITVMAVPGNINSPMSVGTNKLIKDGAAPVTSYLDVIYELGLQPHETKAKGVYGRNANEQKLLDLMLQGINDGEILLERSRLSVTDYNQVLTMLEIGGKIRPLGGNQWGLY